jgi:acyl dehydratase
MLGTKGGRTVLAIRYPEILDQPPRVQDWSFDDRDAIAYALSLGLGNDPMDAGTLPFLYERGLKVVPTFPTVIAWIADPTFASLGADPLTALHGAQKIELHRSIELPLKVRVQGRVVDVFDKGEGRGAVMMIRHEMTDLRDGGKIATLTTTCFARAEGGCGGSSAEQPKPHAVPARRPDQRIEFPTRIDAAFLYRLTGDRNPLHVDPDLARRAGFDRPILHGLCSFGICCRAVLAAYADFDPARVWSQEARFVSPVYPGETLVVSLWRDADVISFEASVGGRDSLVIKNGKALLRSSAG